MPRATENLTVEARLDAVEIVLRELLAFSLARRGIVDRARLAVDAIEQQAVLAGDENGRQHAAAVRVALERLTE